MNPYFIFILTIFGTCLLISNNTVFADNTNGVDIQNIQVQPTTIKVGDKFTVTATLVNNSPVPITLYGNTCSMGSIPVSFITIMFDNHVTIKTKDMTCAGAVLKQILNPGKSNMGTIPDYTSDYIATESGIANVTISFSYSVENQTDPTQPYIGHTISKSLLLTVLDDPKNQTRFENIVYPLGPDFGLKSPLKQFKSGTSPSDITCQVYFQLIFKKEDGSPACVKSTSIKKLVSLQWALKPVNELTVEGFQDTYKVGEKIDFTIKFKGLYTCGVPSSIVKDAENKTVWESPIILTLCDPDTGYGEYKWKFGDLYTLILNQTGSYRMNISFSDKILEKELEIK